MTEGNKPLYHKPLVYAISGMDNVTVKKDICYKSLPDEDLMLDIYSPSVRKGDGLPAIIFIHGGPVPLDHPRKDSGQYVGWGKLAAASGMIGITFNHSYHAAEHLPQSVASVPEAVTFIRDHAASFNIDPNRICLWACSGGGPHICFALRDQPDFLRCMVIYYAIMDVQPVNFLADTLNEEQVKMYSAVSYIQNEPLPFPILMVRAGLDHPGLNKTIEGFISQALAANLDIEIMNHAQGQHGFDILDNDSRSKQVISRTIAFIKENI